MHLAKTLSFLSSLSLLIALWAQPIQGEEAPARDIDPKVTKILQQANQAMAAAVVLEYDFEWRGTHLNLGRADGHAMLQRGDTSADLRFVADAEIGLAPAAGALRSHPKRFRIARHSDGVVRWDLDANVAEKAQEAAGLLGLSASLFMAPQMFRDPAFVVEIDGPEYTRYAGTANVDGVDCDVVYLRFPKDGALGEQYFYFGREDHLPRRIQQIAASVGNRADSTFTWAFEMTNLRASQTSAPEASWQVDLPAGVQVSDFDANRPTVGNPAPDWRLTRQDGGQMASRELAGQVTVMNFWATWCPFCRQTMPGMESVRQDFEGQPVEFVAVQIWDPADPSEFLREVGWKGVSLVEGDEVAARFQIGSTPTVVVVDADGVVAARLGGQAVPDGLRESIEKALGGSGG